MSHTNSALESGYMKVIGCYGVRWGDYFAPQGCAFTFSKPSGTFRIRIIPYRTKHTRVDPFIGPGIENPVCRRISIHLKIGLCHRLGRENWGVRPGLAWSGIVELKGWSYLLMPKRDSDFWCLDFTAPGDNLLCFRYNTLYGLIANSH